MKILVIAPHADDETLGMGGSISSFVAMGHEVIVAVLTGHGSEPHPIWPRSNWDAIREECKAAAKILGVQRLIFEDLPAACLDIIPAYEINNVIVNLIKQIEPNEVYIPFAYDLHKDHGAIAYGVTVALRPYLISAKSVNRVLAYETLSETHLAPPYLVPAFQPNVFINISETLDRKLLAMREYKSQIQPDNFPRSIEGLKALARVRGTHIGVEAAEGFVLIGEYQR
jgi:LmbE family N-acetylglucosaminyl deacetylase